MSTHNYVNATLVRITALVLNAMGTIFLFPFILHSIGEHDFGLWSVTASIASYFLLADFGISLACTRFLSLSIDDKESWKKILSNSVALSLVVMAVLLIAGVSILLLITANIYIGDDKTLSIIIGIIIIESGISMVLRVYQSVLRANVKFLELGYLEIIRVIMRLVGLPLIIINGGSLLHLVVYSSTANILFFLGSYLYVRFHYKQTFFRKELINFRTIADLFNFGKYAIIVQLAELVRYRLDGIFIGSVMGIATIAQYAIMITAVDMAVQILSRFLSYWETVIMRHIGKNEDDESIRVLFRSINIGFWVSAIFIFNFYLLGELFLTLWVGEKYAHLADDLTLLSTLMLVVTFQMSISPYLNGHGLQKSDAMITVIEISCKVLLAVPLIHWLGFKGLMLATIVPGLLTSITARLMLVSKASSIPYSALLLRLIKESAVIVFIALFLIIVNAFLSAISTHSLAQASIMLVSQMLILVTFYTLYKRNNKMPDPLT